MQTFKSTTILWLAAIVAGFAVFLVKPLSEVLNNLTGWSQDTSSQIVIAFFVLILSAAQLSFLARQRSDGDTAAPGILIPLAAMFFSLWLAYSAPTWSTFLLALALPLSIGRIFLTDFRSLVLWFFEAATLLVGLIMAQVLYGYFGSLGWALWGMLLVQSGALLFYFSFREDGRGRDAVRGNAFDRARDSANELLQHI